MKSRDADQLVMRNQLGRLWKQISPRRRYQLSLLLFLTLLTSTAEVISIGAVIPFLGALLAPEKLMGYPALDSLLKLFGITEPAQLPMLLTSLFVTGALLSGAMRILLSWSSIRLAHGIGADLSYLIYQRTLYQPYSVHITRNSSLVIAAVVTKVNSVINGVITPVMTLVSSLFLTVAIAAVLFAISPQATLFSIFGFGIIYLLIIRITRQLKRRNGEEIASKTTYVVKALQEGLAGIRDILIDGSQKTYCAIYRTADASLRRAQGSNQFIAHSPRFAIEAIGMSLIAAIALILSIKNGGIESSIPVLGALAIGAQRMLPVMQQSYSAWSSLISNLPMLKEALILLEQPVLKEELRDTAKVISFEKQIRFCKTQFRYGPEHPLTLDKIDVIIEKGGRVGIVGKTGSGKSTFVDVLMGLLTPVGGHLEVDGVRIDDDNRRAWQSKISHVPQTIFLTDSSIAENIAFGTPGAEIDLDRIREAASQAQIAADIETWPMGYQTRVGERGISLSGGQRQRIGIARALYKKADVIIFDEATSALDGETEDAVMAAIEGLSKKLTIIIIAHRKSTLKNCTKIIELIKSGPPLVRTYEEITPEQNLTKMGW